MRQVIMIVVAAVVVFGLYLALPKNEVQACVKWCEPPTCLFRDDITNECTKWFHKCCDSGPLDGNTCGSGYYACNNASGCCAVGTGSGCECGVKADGTCKGCGVGTTDLLLAA
jgi:hypothetical protein